jgi:hypothetical protein
MVTSADAFTVTLPPAPPAAPWSPPPPKITAVNLGGGRPGTRVTIRGSSLGRTTAVTLGGVPARFVVVSDNRIVVTVPRGGGGRFAVTTPGGTAVSRKAFRVRRR